MDAFSQLPINIHSIHLLPFLRTSDDIRDPVVVSSYTFMAKGPSISEQEFLLQQCMQVYVTNSLVSSNSDHLY